MPSPNPLDVIIHSGPADWWVILAGLGPLAVLVAALLAFYINWRTLKQRTTADKTTLEQKREADARALQQKTEADSRAEWWRRTQWALDRALDGDEGTKALGLATLDVLARSELARKEELELFDIAWKNVSGDDTGDGNGDAVEADGEEADGQDLDGTKESGARAMTAGGPPADAVDSGGFMGENGTTQEDEAKEVGP